ncbi:G-protein coupled receptor GRL101-like [Littorina saxatilis]|uniref:G-protein coupled receptor GRL101-like n=1 Tax=Littorina saxatilis TaxID=31220 RepID=UPI0038B532C8
MNMTDPTSFFQVNCSWGIKGYVQTYNWGQGGPVYTSNDAAQVALLHVPADHVIMVSLVSQDLCFNLVQDCFDFLGILKKTQCDSEFTRFQSTSLFENSVYFVYTRHGKKYRTGFRLLYSYHQAPEYPRKEAGGDLWNCSVPYYSAFQQHFACSFRTFCSDGRDKIDCPTEELCGPNIRRLGGNCYRFFQPDATISWDAANETCSNYKGLLAGLSSTQELHFSGDFLLKKNNAVFAGLSLATPKEPEMYQTAWLWSDQTLAVRFDITVGYFFPPLCAALRKANDSLKTVSCGKPRNAGFLCLITPKSSTSKGNNLDKPGITLPKHSAWTMKGMANCSDWHITHKFLACDVPSNCSADNPQKVQACADNFTPSMPYFTCRNGVELIPYTLVCDHRSDCCDKSDEDFCVYPDCTQSVCADRKQCIPQKQLCDKVYQCIDKSDESKCRQFLLPSDFTPNQLSPPARVDFTGLGNFIVTALDHAACGETHFLCPQPNGGYCLPVYVRCNGVNDCPGREDEEGCENYSCPDFYRCRASQICLHQTHLCDGVFQCPQHDDELLCGSLSCPKNCTCYGLAFICSEQFNDLGDQDLRYLDVKNTETRLSSFVYHTMLIHLGLENCNITQIGEMNCPNLHSLDLSYNKLKSLSGEMLRQLPNLRRIYLAHNPIVSIRSLYNTIFSFPKVDVLNLSGIPMLTLSHNFSQTFPKVEILNLSSSGLDTVSQTGFRLLERLRVLDLQGCPMNTFSPGLFDGLTRLRTIHADNYKLCCPRVRPPSVGSIDCHAPKDEVSSCDDLLRDETYRFFLALYAVLALFGNAGSFIYRVFIDKQANAMGYDIFVTHLCGADFLMGVYLAIIGIADRTYQGNYLWNDIKWKHSAACKAAGFLSLLSSEVSALLICVITLERFLVLRFPFEFFHLGRWKANVTCICIWVVGILLAAVPLSPAASHWEFYSQTGICIPLPITRKQFGGSDYAFGVMIVFNFVLFIFIAVGQLLIFWTLRPSLPRKLVSSHTAVRDSALAIRLLAVVITDFFCWFPIGLLGILARKGVSIRSEINVAMAIFVLPFNSALNPFLYTLNIMWNRHTHSPIKLSPTTHPTKPSIKTRCSQSSSVERHPKTEYRSSHNVSQVTFEGSSRSAATPNNQNTDDTDDGILAQRTDGNSIKELTVTEIAEEQTENSCTKEEAFKQMSCFLNGGLLTEDDLLELYLKVSKANP